MHSAVEQEKGECGQREVSGLFEIAKALRPWYHAKTLVTIGLRMSTECLRKVEMKQRALRLVLASTLALSLVPALAFAEAAGRASGGEYAGIPEPEYQDTTGEQANSFRFTDGIPDNVIYEENEKWYII